METANQTKGDLVRTVRLGTGYEEVVRLRNRVRLQRGNFERDYNPTPIPHVVHWRHFDRLDGVLTSAKSDSG